MTLSYRWAYFCGASFGVVSAALGCGSTNANNASPPGSTSDSGVGEAGTVGDAAQSSSDAGLPQGIYRLAGDDAGLPDQDLAPLGNLISSAQYIGLGESVHTSGGFYAMKNRVIRYLVEQKGVRALAMETPRTNAEVASAYIERGLGTLDDAISAIFPVFVSPDTTALFQWLYEYDAAHPSDPVYFYGFDAQQPADDSAILQAFLSTAVPSDGPGLWAPIGKNCDMDYATGSYTGVFDACGTALDALTTYLTAHQAALTVATSAEDVSRASMAVISLKSWQGEVNYITSNYGLSNQSRDQAMAQIFVAMHTLRSPNAKTLLWAHNYHLSAHHWDVNDPGFGMTMTMGSYLSMTLGAAYQPIAQAAYKVGIDWAGVGYGYSPLPTGSNTLEVMLHGLGEPFLLVDTKSPWLGAGKSYEFGNPAPALEIPAEQYRAILYLDDSPPMVSPFWKTENDGGTFEDTPLTPTPSTVDGGLEAGSGCVLEPLSYVGEVDLCASLGLACVSGALDPASVGTCELPDVGMACAPATGCAAGGECVAISGATYACRQKCTTTSDCTNLYQTCAVVPPSSDPVCMPLSCASAPFSACGEGDGGAVGTCVPVPAANASFCLAAGSAAPSGPCIQARTDAGAAVTCPASTVCIAGYSGSACLPLCSLTASGDAGATGCAGGHCVDVGEIGVCLAVCATSTDCPGAMRCETVTQPDGSSVMGCTY